MTNHWIDIKNADCMMIIGANPAENHPISFKWVTKAMEERGAKLIVVDPHQNRTSAKADIYARLRSGTDIAFIGGMINYVLEDMRKNPDNYNTEYVSQYTNAAYILKTQVLPADNNGVFSGWDANAKKYDKTAWEYNGGTAPSAESRLLTNGWSGWFNRANDDPNTAWGELNANCVLRLLHEHYKRYDLATVSNITGVPQEKLTEVCAEYAKTGARNKAGTIMYAMGATQHTYGSQNIRTYSILQSLLGNMGIAGGGINALRGTSNVQGSTDMALLSHIIPGYIGVPNDTDTELGTKNSSGVWTKDSGYLKRITPTAISNPTGVSGSSANWKQHFPKYVVSMLKSWWKDVDPAVSFHYLPKVKASGQNYTHIGLIESIGAGTIKGLMVWGQNPAAGGPTSLGARNALGKLEWMVCADVWENETAEFWKRPGVNSADINTEVILLPAAASYEKEGSVTNSGRMAQWRYVAVNPPGEAKPDLEILDEVVKAVKALYQADYGNSKFPDPITNLTWDYSNPVTADEVAQEINGKALSAFTPSGRTVAYVPGELIDSFLHLQANGSTSCGNWIFSQQYSKASAAELENFAGLLTEVAGVKVINRLRKRGTADSSTVGLYSNWAWTWPVNRRIIYNRASIDLNGNSWDPSRAILTWDAAGKKWLGDVVDGFGSYGPIGLETNSTDSATGVTTLKRILPFIMNSDGMSHLWGGATMNDGPLPEHYEPWETPFSTNPIGHGTLNDPTAYRIGGGGFLVNDVDQNPKGTVDQYPYVGTTYRCTEHWQTGIMTRNLPWLNELQPNMYVEIGEDLATELGVQAGDKVEVSSARGSVNAVAVVTKRFAAIEVNGRTIHHVGVLIHWGYSGLSTGDTGNILTPSVGDANTSIPEFKTFLCNVTKA
jgi:formate dehydrogenase major subunit